jgi:hypothetical protein
MTELYDQEEMQSKRHVDIASAVSVTIQKISRLDKDVFVTPTRKKDPRNSWLVRRTCDRKNEPEVG